MAYSGIGYSCRFISVFFVMLVLSACGGGGGSGECEALTEISPIPDINVAGAYAAALAVQTNDYAQSIEDAAALPPDQLTVRLTLPNRSFVEEAYSCRVDRCAENPDELPNFSPAPPACGGEQE